MTDKMPIAEIRDLELDGGDRQQPLSRSLYLALRERVLDGRLRPGTRLPASRSLAQQLGVGRNTVIAAFDQLMTEGYLSSITGSGTFVSKELPESWLSAQDTGTSLEKTRINVELSDYGNSVASNAIRSSSLSISNSSFTVGVPDLRNFPARIWNRLCQQIPTTGLNGLMGFSDPAGYPALREAIADYIRSSRAVVCEADQIIVTSGAQQALDLTARLLLNPGDRAVLEEPGYLGTRRALLSTGAEIIPCPVDDNGLLVDTLRKLPVTPKLVYVTPAHQYPMGSMMNLERRTELLEWAYQNQCWILEDDYDSEYHYNHRPLASLQGLARQHQVIYIGSFSKVLFPALRLGYMVLPPELVDVFTKAKLEHSGDTPLHSQAVTAAFIQEGHFSRHLRKMRISYAEKLNVMLEACKTLSPWCKVHAQGAGMHLVLEFTDNLNEELIAEQLYEQQVCCSRLSSYFMGTKKRQGLVLGFTNSTEAEIVQGISNIRNVLNLSRPEQ